MSGLKVFYSEHQSVEESQGFSPSASKPKLVLESWKKLGIPLEIVEPVPASFDDFCLAHDPDYVRGVLDCKIPNGFGNCSPEVAASLPFTTGSMMSAAFHAIKTGESCCSPTSGFHHAGWGHGAGYCTFNSLAVSSIKLQHFGAGRIGILDLDQHWGDGTQDIIDQLKISYVEHWSLGNSGVQAGESAKEFIEGLFGLVTETFEECDVLLYQAGADCHVDDPLGGRFTTDQLRKRDRAVFEACKAIDLPIVFNLAGGYQNPIRKVLDLHDITALEFQRVFSSYQ